MSASSEPTNDLTVEKLITDSERLDWLEAKRPRVGLGEDGAVRLLARDGLGELLASEPTFRAAIDAASRRSEDMNGTTTLTVEER